MSQLHLPTAIRTSQVSSSLFRVDHDAETQRKWMEHLQTTDRNDPTDGLTDTDWQVLEEPEPVTHKRAVYFYQGHKVGECDLQKTVGYTTTVERLHNIGLIHIVEYIGGIWLATHKRQLNPKAVIWAYSYEGIIKMQNRLGIRGIYNPDFKIDYEYHLHVGEKELKVLEMQFRKWLERNPIRRIKK